MHSEAEEHAVPAQALLELARSASEDPLPQVLEAVADTILRAAGYRTVVVNVYRPQWDDFEVVIVVGDQAGRDQLLGTSTPRETVLELLEDADQQLHSVYFLAAGGSPVWDKMASKYTPDLPEPTSPDAWLAGDALIVMLSDRAGLPLGFASMDEPESGLRPTSAELNLVGIICSFAEQALRAARRAAAAEEDNRLLAQLSTISPAISACQSLHRLDALILDVLVSQFGFERAAIYRRVGDDLLPEGSRGWDRRPPPPLTSAWHRVGDALTVAPTGGPERLGGTLVPAAELFGDGSDAAAVSTSNGRGPLAWSDHCLLFAWKADDPEMVRVVVLQDPTDRLLPTEERQRMVRVLVELAASVATGIIQREALDRLASHDALTGVRNRRGLDALINGDTDIALLLCDLDNFKQINDAFGHDAGDAVLTAFGALLREQARIGDIPIRLGGEEFCVILPHTGRAGARAAAERLRIATEEGLSSLVAKGVTVSIGVAVGEAGTVEAGSLLKAADEALYRAKQAGRNRVEIG